MSTQMRIKYDENKVAENKLLPTKKFGLQNGQETKRSALGELGNRAVLRTVRDGQKDLKDTKINQINLKNAKPKVDTNWKKPAQVIANNLQPAAAKTNSLKSNIVTRSNSIKSSSVTTGLSNAATLKQLPKPNQATTITAKVVKIENNPSHVRYINKPKIEPSTTKQQQQQIPVGTTIRREDSNLSRRSLSKLKAAIKQQSNIKPTAVAVVSSIRSTPAPESDDKKDAEDAKCKSNVIDVQSHSAKLLDAVENIDADDTENPILVSEYVNEIYAYLFYLETQMPVGPDHLKDQKEVIPKMRAILIDWINEVHHQFHLVPETFHMCVAIIDRYLQAVKTTSRQHLQMVGVTSLFIASKYEELFPPAIGDFIYITDDTYTKNQLLDMEVKIMKALDFNLSRPLPIHFLRRFSKAASAEDCHHAMSKYFLELVTTEYSMAHYRPSEIAAASLYLSLQLMNPSKTPTDEIWNPTLEFYSRYSAEHLKPITRQIATLAKNASSAKLKAVYVKYQSFQLGKISLRSELKGPVIDAIIAKE
ncbi:G2/mitotic-specific cyclin-B [Episyrphus balteatus]|uniref:G2/mitotic-specific cyclin-B n=1 Tax=Episyrphus balteatus TaxID=286459 RepID=UPI002484EE11|nr:G2/mitotic-specific cyclin-B [Episyrphus balteatus]